jgi:hypothetical protein
MFWGIVCFISGYYVGTNYGEQHKLLINKHGIQLGPTKILTINNGTFTFLEYIKYSFNQTIEKENTSYLSGWFKKDRK